jgi:hypothetical protein
MFLMVLSLHVVCLLFQMSQLVGTTVSEELNIPSVSALADIPKIQRRKYEGICPSCNTHKKLTHTLNRTAAAIAILADAAALLQFEKLGVGLHNDPPSLLQSLSNVLLEVQVCVESCSNGNGGY